jgi:NAD(P)-dependent dehydrogenase (short-subunit alcohol dehydrogenase family)
MKANGWGRIIYISSVVASISSRDGHGVYSASKSALEGYARTAAVELGQYGVTVNCIAPGVYLTDLPKARFETMPADLAKQIYDTYANMTAMMRWGDPSELEGPLLLLASDAGSYITGTTLHIDGGLSIRMHSG